MSNIDQVSEYSPQEQVDFKLSSRSVREATINGQSYEFDSYIKTYWIFEPYILVATALTYNFINLERHDDIFTIEGGATFDPIIKGENKLLLLHDGFIFIVSHEFQPLEAYRIGPNKTWSLKEVFTTPKYVYCIHGDNIDNWVDFYVREDIRKYLFRTTSVPNPISQVNLPDKYKPIIIKKVAKTIYLNVDRNLDFSSIESDVRIFDLKRPGIDVEDDRVTYIEKRSGITKSVLLPIQPKMKRQPYHRPEPEYDTNELFFDDTDDSERSDYESDLD